MPHDSNSILDSLDPSRRRGWVKRGASRVHAFVGSVGETFLVAARSGNACRFIGVFNVLNALQSAWFHNSWFVTGFSAFVGIYCLWISSLVSRDNTLTIALPPLPPQLIAEMKRQAEIALIETDPKKVM